MLSWFPVADHALHFHVPCIGTVSKATDSSPLSLQNLYSLLLFQVLPGPLPAYIEVQLLPSNPPGQVDFWRTKPII